jgi:hypothetical protein
LNAIVFLCAATLALGACARGPTSPGGANPVDGVVINVQAPGQCLVGGCDPPNIGLTLALISVVNTGSATAYLRACGQYVAINEQQFTGGEWVFVGPAITCPVTPGPIVLAAGDSLRVNQYFAPGTRRIVIGVAASSSLSDEAPDNSAPFVVH